MRGDLMSSCFRFLSFAVPFFLIFSSFVQSEGLPGQDEAAIREKSARYVKAYNDKDVETFINLWADDAQYINPATGQRLAGKAALRDLFESTFKDNKDSRLDIAINAISFPKPGKAVEFGVISFIFNGEPVGQTAYKAVYENINGEWRLKQVRESRIGSTPSQYEKLKGLEWLIGSWIDQDEDVDIRILSRWDRNKNFIIRHFKFKTEGHLELDGRQLIAWDPIKNEIRSWLFDSDGGFGEGVWKQRDNKWYVERSQTLADGRRASAIDIFTPIDSNTFLFQSTGREVGGVPLPDIEPVKVVRVQ